MHQTNLLSDCGVDSYVNVFETTTLFLEFSIEFESNDLTYHQDTNKPVTGIVEEFYSNGQLMGRGNFIDGKRHGLMESFHENGQLEYKGNVIDDGRDGLWEWFQLNG